ncbi:MAG: heme-binding domain-containing protein [Chitinophagaceae bacterium]|nr:heme-binding domain-containing protein [Chitinophagaceae bacterium]
MAKKFLYGLLIVLVVMQLFQPDRNVSNENLRTDIANHYKIPDTVENLLSTICYDCHSNNTDYPWFINMQPVGWYMQSKIERGKKHLNFSEFGSLTKEQAIKKLTLIDDVMKTNRMPLRAYNWYNHNADLNDEQRKAISHWAQDLRDLIMQDSSQALNPEK